MTVFRLSATTFGRPVLHSRPNVVPLPEAIDDEYLSESGEGCQPQNTPSRIEFFRHSIKLFDILKEILDRFYSPGYQTPEEDDINLSTRYLGEVPRIYSQIDEFLINLPRHLQADGSMETLHIGSARHFRMQAQILKSRYVRVKISKHISHGKRVLYIRLLLLRPSILIETKRMLSNDTLNKRASLLPEAILADISRLCVSTAHETLEEIHQKINSLHQSSAWHALFCIN